MIMKLYKYSLVLLLGLSTLTACNDKLDLTNPNRQTSGDFGYDDLELEESVIAAYNHIRMEGTYSRVGYNYDVCRGDEAWNCSQVWYLNFDDLNARATDEMTQWVWRDWYYTINVCNFVISRTDGVTADSDKSVTKKRTRGQALFLRGLAYYNLVGYYQNPAVVTDYASYSSIESMSFANSTYDDALDQCEADLTEAMTLLPTRDEGGEWAAGRATKGAAAGYLARAKMMRPSRENLQSALETLKKIINKEYGSYKLMVNYGDNFREGTKYENNEESLFEIQFLDYGSQGANEEWTPVNVTSDPTQAHAVETNFAPADFGGWADISASPWLYNLFKSELTKDGTLDPRLYWTIGTYEDDWEGYEYGNVAYQTKLSKDLPIQTNNNNGGLPIAKWTNMRTGLYKSVVQGLHCGINLRLMRYSDVLLRAAECENELNGPTQQAIDWINEVRRRANMKDLQLVDFAGNADKLFEQIANVERPKEFGCEFGRGFDLIRWGFFYSTDRLQQLKEHGTFRRHNYIKVAPDDETKKYADGDIKAVVPYSLVGVDPEVKSSYDTYVPGHEFLPIYQGLLSANHNLRGNSANNNIDNAAYFTGKGWKIHPVVK